MFVSTALCDVDLASTSATVDEEGEAGCAAAQHFAREGQPPDRSLQVATRHSRLGGRLCRAV